MGATRKATCKLCGRDLSGRERYRVKVDRRLPGARHWRTWRSCESYCKECWQVYARHAAVAMVEAAREVRG